MCDFRHCRDANLPLTDGGVAVHTGATGRSGVIEVNQLSEARMDRSHLLDVFQRLMTAGKHVAGIDADAEPGVVDVCDEAGELLPGAEHFCALACGRLQEDWTSWCCVLDGL